MWNYETVARGNTHLPTPPEGRISIPTWKDELYLEFHRGVFTTQSNHKRNMRESEELVLNAEKYATLAWLDGQPYRATELTDAWKKVVFNQFHDLAAGSGIGVIYRDAQQDYDQVRWATQEVEFEGSEHDRNACRYGGGWPFRLRSFADRESAGMGTLRPGRGAS